MRSREVEVDGNKEFYKDPAKRYLSDFGPVQLSWPFKNQTFGPKQHQVKLLLYKIKPQV